MSDEPVFDAVVIDGSRDLSTVVVFLTLSPAQWCVIGGHATDSYAPPALYAARVDVATDREPVLALRDLVEEGFRVQVDARTQVAYAIRPGDGHRLRVCIHFGPQFQAMPGRATRRAILGRELPVASLEDVAQGLLVVRADPAQGWHDQGKAELDLVRLCAQHPAEVSDLLPDELRASAARDREHALAYPDGDGWGESFAL